MNLGVRSWIKTVIVVSVLLLGFPGSPPVVAQECPEFVSRLVNPRAQAVDRHGGLLVIGRGSMLQVADLSTPAMPVVLGNLELGEEIVDLDISNGLVVVAVGESGVRVVDIDNPSLPIEVGAIDTPGNARAIEIWENLAIVAVEDAGVRVIDVSSPSEPFEAGFFDADGAVYDVTVSNGLAYLADQREGLRILDISEPSAPTEVGALGAQPHIRVAVAGDQAFVVDQYSRLRIISVSTPSTPTTVGEISLQAPALDIEVQGSLVYLAADRYGLTVIDISSPSEPTKVGFLDTPGDALGLAVSGDLVYIADEFAGLRVIDASFPPFPHEIGALDSTIYASKVAVSGDIVYVAGYRGLHIIDTTTLASPIEISRDPSPASTVALSGQLLFVGTGTGLRVYDISIPESPIEIADTQSSSSSWPTCGGGVGLAIEDDLVYALCNHWDLALWDVSDPQAPVHLSTFNTSTYPKAVAAEGDFAYVLDDYSLLRVIDVTAPDAPHQVGLFDMWSATDIAVSDGLVYVACGTEGLRIIDVSTPSEPIEVGLVATSDSVGRVALAGDLAFVTGGSYANPYGTLGVIDISQTSEATEICSVETPGSSLDVEVSGGRIFLAQGNRGLTTFRAHRHVYQYWLDTAAHLPGLFGSRWRTDVVARNTGAADADVEFRLHSSEGIMEISNSVSPGDQGVFTDVVGMMDFQGKGCLEVRTSEPLQVSGRTYNHTEDGTFGQYVDGHRSSDGLTTGESGTLLQLRQKEGKFRTNISLTNTGHEPAVIRIRLYRESGERLALYTLSVAPESLLQDPEPFKRRAGEPDLGWGFAVVEAIQGTGVLVSASVVDSATNDATTIPAKR